MPANPTDFPVRFSHLKNMARSPAHYLHALYADKQTPAMRLGKLVHAVILGGAEYAVYEGKRQGKAWELFALDHADQDIVTATELATAQAMAAAVERHPESKFLLGGPHEQELDFEIAGRRCQAHVDVVGGLHITELKTGQTSQPGRFEWHALRMQYHAQLAWYLDAMRAIGSPRTNAYILMVEAYAPHVVTAFQATERALEEGRKRYRVWFEQLMNCEESNIWPGYCDAILPLDVGDDESLGLTIDGEELEVA